MKRPLGRSARREFAGALVLPLLLLSPAGSTIAAELQEAQVTRIIKDVRLLPTQAVPRPAAVNDTVRSDTAVRTGDESRTELTFTDQTLARLGANSIFTFNEGTRNLDLGTGVMLLHVPKGAGGAKISTAAVTAAITGTTVLIEAHSGKRVAAVENPTQDGDPMPVQFGLVNKTKPANSKAQKGYVKFISLEGTARVFLNGHPEESVLVHPGQMLILAPGAAHLPELVEVDLKKLVATCLLITEFPPLPSEPLIAEEIAKQQGEGVEGEGIPDIDPTSHDVIDLALNGFPIVGGGGGGFGPEFGPLTTITAPVPYIINAGTTIMTAPLITTAGVTNQGKIYRSVLLDGSASAYFFGSTSGFDSATLFDALGEGGGNRIPMAAFKFTSLEIDGNPTITVPPGGAINLGLVSEGGITSGGAGSTLTFAGMNAVMLAAQNGSINLGASLAFSNLNDLFLYARGATSDITLGSPVTGAGVLQLQAERNVQINSNSDMDFLSVFAGVDFLDGSGHVTANSIGIRALNNLTFTTNDYTIVAGPSELNIDLVAGATINFDVRTDSSALANLSVLSANGGSITFTPDPGGSTVTFGGFATLTAASGGVQAAQVNLVSPGNALTISSQGDITAAEILGGATISSQGNITTTSDVSSQIILAGGNINVGGNLTNTQLTSAVGPTSTITVAGTLTSPEVDVTGDIMANHVSVLQINPNVATSNSILTVGAGGITPFLAQPGSVHQFTVMTVESTNGIDFSGNNFSTPGSNGASLILNAQNQTFGVGGISGANFDGGDAPMPGSPAGGGGTLTVNTTTGNIVVGGSSLNATTGIIGTNDPPSGAGGTVNLSSNSGTVAVISGGIIQVSSSDAVGTPNRRSSASGGNISLQSGAATGTAVSVTNTGQLLSLLENAAPGPGGLITISASSLTGNSQVNIAGMIEADHGGIDIRNSNDGGTISIGSNLLMADVIKIATLGDNSTLNIGAANISAATLLRLYAGSISMSNNSTINFTASCFLTGAEIDIAAHTVNIVGAGTQVMTSSQAHVFATVANYQGSGGTGGGTTGTFTGAGATTQPLIQAPPLGPPGGGIAPALSKNHIPPTGPGGH